MKKGRVLSGFCIAALCVFSSAWAGPLAPSAPLDEGMAMAVPPEDRVVPDASAVGIPVYPGSRFCTVTQGRWGPKGAVEVRLLSAAPYAEVRNWYGKKMKGWHCREWGEGVLFKCSDRDPGPAGNYDYESFNVVKVVKTEVAVPCVLEGMKTGITISYQPD